MEPIQKAIHLVQRREATYLPDKVVKLPDDFLGNVTAFLNTPPPPRKAKRKKAIKKTTKGKQTAR